MISCDEFLVQNGRERNDVLKVFFEGVHERWLKDMRSLAGVIDVGFVDVPSADFKITWVDHWHKVLDWLVDVLEVVGLLIVFVSNVSGGSLGEGTVEVWVLNTSLGLPSLFLFVGEDSGNESRSVVSSKADKHDSKLWDGVDGFNSVGELLDGLALLSLIPHWD